MIFLWIREASSGLLFQRSILESLISEASYEDLAGLPYFDEG